MSSCSSSSTSVSTSHVAASGLKPPCFRATRRHAAHFARAWWRTLSIQGTPKSTKKVKSQATGIQSATISCTYIRLRQPWHMDWTRKASSVDATFWKELKVAWKAKTCDRYHLFREGRPSILLKRLVHNSNPKRATKRKQPNGNTNRLRFQRPEPAIHPNPPCAWKQMSKPSKVNDLVRSRSRTAERIRCRLMPRWITSQHDGSI